MSHTFPSKGRCLISKLKEIGPVTFPDVGFEYQYMIPFFQAKGLEKIHEKWQTTVDDMLRGIQCGLPMYLYISQGMLSKGDNICHSRGPRIHGNWCYTSYVRNGAIERSSGKAEYWELRPETIIIASSHMNIKGHVGRFNGSSSLSGSVAHLSLDGGHCVALEGKTAYACNEAFIHDYLPVWKAGTHTVVRIHIPHLELELVNRQPQEFVQ